MKKFKITLIVLVAFLINNQISIAQTTYSYTGLVQTYEVPSGITLISIEAFGAQGKDNPDTGGAGGTVKGDISVTPGDMLYIYVGGTPTGSVGGYNGGGDGANSATITGGGGGGASDVRLNGLDLGDRIIVAGGGGAGGQFGGGAGGDLIGEDGTSGGSTVTAIDAGGGSQTTGGLGGSYSNGTCAPGSPAFNGVLGFGGAGVIGVGDCTDYAGYGGGGGYYGGGGMQINGGAGGSNYIVNTATNITNYRGGNTGNGIIVITEICNEFTYTITPSTEVCEGTMVTITGSSAFSFSWTNGITDGVPFSANASTVYSNVSTEGDCIVDVIVTVNEIDTTINDVTLCEGDSFTFPDDSIQYNIVSDLNQTSVLSTSTCDSIVITNITVSDCSTTSIKNIISNKLKLYPNPVDDLISFKSKEVSKIEIYNYLGSIIMETNSNEINVKDLCSGSYIAKVYNKNSIISINKFTKK